MADRGRWLLARIYCMRISDFQILLYSVQYSFWQAAEGSASSSTVAEFRLRRNFS
jgi:uncharacterized protein YggL (DUF469 family)